MISVRFWMPVVLKKLREFEQACEKWDDMFADNDSQRLLPSKEKATDDDSADADRPDRVIMDLLNSLPKESV